MFRVDSGAVMMEEFAVSKCSCERLEWPKN